MIAKRCDNAERLPSARTVDGWLREREALPAAPRGEGLKWDSRWGKYIVPSAARAPAACRVALLSGSPIACALLRGLTDETGVSIVGIATDELIERRARISRRKRVWRHLTPRERAEQQAAVELTALRAGAPVFSGDIKSRAFQQIFARWAPDVILMCCFGQLLLPAVFTAPALGAYNFHPSNLDPDGDGGYPGTTPIESAIADQRSHLPTTCHHIDEAFDTGPFVGVGRPVSLRDDEGRYLPVFGVLEALGPEVTRMAKRLLAALRSRRAPVHRLDLA